MRQYTQTAADLKVITIKDLLRTLATNSFMINEIILLNFGFNYHFRFQNLKSKIIAKNYLRLLFE
jgi:hypothetical protein